MLFFAQVRELTGVERLSVDAGFASVEALRQALAARGDRWALAPGKLLAAVNQSLVTAMKWRSSHRSREAEWRLP